MFGGIPCPLIVGVLQNLTHGFAAGLSVIAAFPFVAAANVYAVASRSRVTP